MNTRALALVLILATSTLAGCTAGDPDAGGTDEISPEMFQSMIENMSANISIEFPNEPPSIYYETGEFGYWGDDYSYDKGTWTQVSSGSWTWVGTPSNWIDVMTIDRAEGELIRLISIDFVGMINETYEFENSGHADDYPSGQWFSVYRIEGSQTDHDWEIDCANGINETFSSTAWYYDNMVQPNPNDFSNMFPFSGSKCSFTLNFRSQVELEIVKWSVIYSVEQISEGPHN
jgi:hypothetical protein